MDHTADIEYIAYGKSRDELFANALSAMFDTMAYVKRLERQGGKATVFAVRTRADRLEDLFWYSLQDTLSELEARRLFAYKIRSLKVSRRGGAFFMRAEIMARKRTDALSKLAVKGVSRYDLMVWGGKAFQAGVVLDV